MRKINPENFKMATRGTSREINRQIALTLIRSHQPVSRADLARLMETNRANVTFLINGLLGEKLVREGATGGESKRGRKPMFLYLNSQQRCAVAVDVRATRTFLMLTDMIGRQLEEIVSFPTELNPEKFIEILSRRIEQLFEDNKEFSICDSIGVVVPGLVDRRSSKILNAPTLAWRDVNLLKPLREKFAKEKT